MEMDADMQSELKALRKKLYTYHNKLLEIERQSRFTREEYNGHYSKRRRTGDDGDEASGVVAFESSNTPLRNEYILEMIANYMPSQDLRRSRLVCRIFNKELSRCLAARKTLIVTEGDCPEATAVVKNSAQSTLVAVGSICFFDIPSNNLLFKKLMTCFGWTLSGLKLEECKRSPQDLVAILTKHAPNLESFSYKDRALPESQRASTFLNMQHYLTDSRRLYLPDLKRLDWDEEFGRVELEHIIKACPNLIELVYKNTSIPSPSNYKNLHWETLRTLKLFPRDELRDEYVLSLISLKLKLQRITFFGVTPTLSAKMRMYNLKMFLKSVSSTLEDLELFQHHSIRARYDSTNESPFPVSLPVLKRLNIDFSILKSLKTLNALPQLNVFDCTAKHCDDWELLGKKGYPDKNPNVQILCLGSINSKSLAKFTNCFPMCSNLELYPEHIDDNAMRVIIRGFPQLQQLKIAKLAASSKIPLLSDSGLTGLTSATCKKLAKAKLIQDNFSEKEKKFPAIYDLKELIRLEILAEESFLTDLSVIYGVVKCPKLAILGLPKAKFTDSSLNKIREKLKLTLLDLPCSSNFSQDAINALKNSNKDMILQSVQGFCQRN